MKSRYRDFVEMQVVPKPSLEHRARYYHGQIDMELLGRGCGYRSLPDVYVIFICDFDPFARGKYRYTFRNQCLEEEGFILPDGQTTMFLSTCGKNPEEVPGNLVSFLKYIGSNLQESTEESEDDYVRRLQAAVRGVKASREMGAKYMIFQEMLEEERAAGIAEGMAKGRAEGITEGMAKGKTEDRMEAILELLEDLPGEVPESLKNTILSEKDMNVLRRYLKQAAAAASVEEFAQNI